MNRELKFRHWLKSGSRWLDHVNIDNNGCLYPITNSGEHDYNIDCNVIVTMQYTGLKDKNGKDIYEGDVRRETIERNNGDDVLYYVCVYIKELCRFGWLSISEYDEYLDTGIEHFEDIDLLGMDESEIKHYVICGNIYEHPKYLKPLP